MGITALTAMVPMKVGMVRSAFGERVWGLADGDRGEVTFLTGYGENHWNGITSWSGGVKNSVDLIEPGEAWREAAEGDLCWFFAHAEG